jgi:hypothetical protein
MPRFTVFLFSILTTLSLLGGAVFAAPPGRFSAQLAAESDALLACAIHRPYGWAWGHDLTADSTGHRMPRAVSMEPLGTPAAGLILLWTGELLNEPRYREAADQVARGVAAAEMPVGRVRAHPLFGPAAGGREELVPIADRSATNCAIGLFLATLDARQPATAPADSPGETELDPQLEYLRGAAARCAHWLARQQSPNGLWPSTFPTGPWTPKTIRLVRLDSSDYRDTTLALLLSFDSLHDDTLRHFSNRPLDGLLKLRLTSDEHGPGLWCTACTVEGTDIPTSFPNGPDVLASRYAMQTLLGAYLLTKDREIPPALTAAATTLAQVKRTDGSYDRFLDPTAAADVARLLGNHIPATQTFFAHPTTQAANPNSILADRSTSGAFGIPEMLNAVSRLKPLGPDRFSASFPADFSLHQQIEASLCGLLDDPFTLDFPTTAKAVPAFLAAHADLWKPLDGPAPDDLPGRVRRLWSLYLRADLERLHN